MTTKIYPSAAAFMIGPLVKTTKHSSCFRYMWACSQSGLSKEELNQPVAAEYSALGSLDEYRFSVKLKKEGKKFDKEVPFSVAFKGVTISGRQDFVLDDGTVIEKKSTTSAHVYKRVFEQGVPEPSHMAQLVSYLAFLKAPEGRLVVTYYELDEELTGYIAISEKEFIVKCLDDGRIMLGQELYSYSVRDLARWYATAEKFLTDPWTVPHKPCQSGSKYESPCNYCPLKKVCESGTDVALDFVAQAREALLDKKPAKEFTIRVNTERRQKNRDAKNNSKV